MAQTWDDDETDRAACRRASGGRGPATGGRTQAALSPAPCRLPPAPQAIGRLLVLLAGLGAVLLMGAVLWVGLGLVVTVLLRLLGP